MKKLVICLIIFLNTTALFSQDFFINERHGSNLSQGLHWHDLSVFEFANIFSSNALRILMGDLSRLDWPLDIFSLAQLDNQHLRLLRNLIFARHGLIFNSPDLVSYFSRFGWYNPRYDNVDHLLANVDRWNIQRIQAFENRNENLPTVVLNNHIGFWHDSPFVASGYGERFIIHPNNRMELFYSQMRPLPIGNKLSGTYAIRGNVLTFSVTEIYFSMNNSIIRQGYDWESMEMNRMVLETPILFKFPITNIELSSIQLTDRERTILERETFSIGGQRVFKLSDDVNHGRRR